MVKSMKNQYTKKLVHIHTKYKIEEIIQLIIEKQENKKDLVEIKLIFCKIN